MQLVFIEVSKYIFAFLLCFYAAAAYRGAAMKEEKRKFTYAFQNVIMFMIHLLGFLILYQLNNEDIKYLILYFAQFIYLFVTIFVYDVFISKSFASACK